MNRNVEIYSKKAEYLNYTIEEWESIFNYHVIGGFLSRQSPYSFRAYCILCKHRIEQEKRSDVLECMFRHLHEKHKTELFLRRWIR